MPMTEPTTIIEPADPADAPIELPGTEPADARASLWHYDLECIELADVPYQDRYELRANEFQAASEEHEVHLIPALINRDITNETNAILRAHTISFRANETVGTEVVCASDDDLAALVVALSLS